MFLRLDLVFLFYFWQIREPLDFVPTKKVVNRTFRRAIVWVRNYRLPNRFGIRNLGPIGYRASVSSKHLDDYLICSNTAIRFYDACCVRATSSVRRNPRIEVPK